MHSEGSVPAGGRNETGNSWLRLWIQRLLRVGWSEGRTGGRAGRGPMALLFAEFPLCTVEQSFILSDGNDSEMIGKSSKLRGRRRLSPQHRVDVLS